MLLCLATYPLGELCKPLLFYKIDWVTRYEQGLGNYGSLVKMKIKQSCRLKDLCWFFLCTPVYKHIN